MKKNVNFCGNCPFLVVDNSESTNKYYCNLSKHMKNVSNFINDPFNESKQQNGCLLVEEEYSFKFKQFSKDRLKEINNLSTKIKILENYFEENDYDIDNSEHKIKQEQLTDFYDKIQYEKNNETPLFDVDELANNMDEIKIQLKELERVTNSLNNIE